MVLCAVGTRAGESCNEHPFCCHCLPATRAQSNAGPDSPFRLTHRGGRSNQGPTTSAPRRERTSNVLIEPSHQLEGSPIHRTGRARKRPRQVVSELDTTAGKRLEAGAGRVEAPSKGQHRPRSCEGRQGGRRRWGRFWNIGRVVLCTRAGESSQQQPSDVADCCTPIRLRF